MENLIRWKRGDYISLGRAVSQFNKKINELNREEKKLYLPDTLTYQEVKQNITTRKELNRLINSLRRFQKEGVEEKYITDAGEEITKWERRELGIQSRIIQNRLQREIKELSTPKQGQEFSRVQMGSQRFNQIQSEIKSLKGIERKRGSEFDRLRTRIRNLGVSDYSMKKSFIFRENYIREMEKYSHLDNFDKLINKLSSIKNPIEFYNYVSQHEMTGDLTYQSDQYFAQQEFNSFLHDLGIEIDIDSVS